MVLPMKSMIVLVGHLNPISLSQAPRTIPPTRLQLWRQQTETLDRNISPFDENEFELGRTGLGFQPDLVIKFYTVGPFTGVGSNQRTLLFLGFLHTFARPYLLHEPTFARIRQPFQREAQQY